MGGATVPADASLQGSKLKAESGEEKQEAARRGKRQSEAARVGQVSIQSLCGIVVVIIDQATWSRDVRKKVLPRTHGCYQSPKKKHGDGQETFLGSRYYTGITQLHAYCIQSKFLVVL